MLLHSRTCPSCAAPIALHEQICDGCGLILASSPPNAAPVPLAVPAPLPPSQFIYTALQPGQSLASNRYTVQRALSKGGMGAIYLAADHEAFDRLVIIKAMLDYFDPADPQAVQVARACFLMEARTLSALRHPAIPQIYTYFKEGAHNYIVMEYIEGHDLEQRLTHVDDATGQRVAGQPYPHSDVIRWGITLCQVLTYLATGQPQPVVHHDIKPANLIRAISSGDIRLVDFGTARARLLAQAGGIGLQQSSVYGTAGYAAPEQYRGTSEPRSDVYALAVTLYHLATDDDPRTHPFQFPALASLGDFGQTLRPALHADVERRPSARDLQRQLELLLLPPTIRPLQAPDGSDLPDVAALALWCEKHWWEGAAWLYGKLPDQIELWWGQTKLARELREIVNKHRVQTAVGLDSALALLDPAGFGAELPQFTADNASLQFGTLRPGSSVSAKVTFSNPGRRLAQVRMQPPRWISTRDQEIALVPGSWKQITFMAESTNIQLYGHQSDKIALRNGSKALTGIDVQAKFARLPVKWGNVATIVVVVAMFVALFWTAQQSSATMPTLPTFARRSTPNIALTAEQERNRLLVAARQSGALRAVIETGQRVSGLAFSDGGQTLLAIDAEAHLRTWSITNTQLLSDNKVISRDISSVAFSSDGRLVAIGSTIGIVYVRSTADGKPLLALDAFNDQVSSSLQLE